MTKKLNLSKQGKGVITSTHIACMDAPNLTKVFIASYSTRIGIQFQLLQHLTPKKQKEQKKQNKVRNEKIFFNLHYVLYSHYQNCRTGSTHNKRLYLGDEIRERSEKTAIKEN